MYKTIWQRAAELMLELIRANQEGGKRANKLKNKNNL